MGDQRLSSLSAPQEAQLGPECRVCVRCCETGLWVVGARPLACRPRGLANELDLALRCQQGATEECAPGRDVGRSVFQKNSCGLVALNGQG